MGVDGGGRGGGRPVIHSSMLLPTTCVRSMAAAGHGLDGGGRGEGRPVAQLSMLFRISCGEGHKGGVNGGGGGGEGSRGRQPGAVFLCTTVVLTKCTPLRSRPSIHAGPAIQTLYPCRPCDPEPLSMQALRSRTSTHAGPAIQNLYP
eukprot:360721-Chlamydomonas_euryale.AAC.1